LRRVYNDFRLFSGGLESCLDGDGWRGAGDGTGATRHARCAQAGRLAFAPLFRSFVHRGRWFARHGLARCDLSALPTDLRFERDDAGVELELVFGDWLQYFSNVPFVLVARNWIARFAEPALMWKVLALATTFAGNLTIIGSVANVIVVESARQHIEVGFWDYARFGIPIAILTTAAGVAVLLALH
jgi:hypothetical protein